MTALSRVTTGIEGLDTVLGGGLLERQNVLIRGPPGAGKTVFSLHFLAAADDDTGLYINLGEPVEYVERTAAAFDLRSDRLHFLELAPTEERFAEGETYSFFSSAEVERPSLVSTVRETVEKLSPDRVVIDPITEFRYLTTDDHQFRSQILALLDFLRAAGATVVLTSQADADLSDTDLQFLTDVVVDLGRLADARTIDIPKFRGPPVRRGPHTYAVSASGVEVWPRLLPDGEPVDFEPEKLPSGVPELDQLLDGGISRGTVTFFSGPTGAGKTTTSLQFVKENAGRGKRGLVLSFEESIRTMLTRSAALNIGLDAMVDRGLVDIVEVRPGEYTGDRLSALIRDAVADGAELVLFDGFQGFQQNLRGHNGGSTEFFLSVGRYLRERGVTTLVTNEVHDITGEFRVTEEGISNLADNIVFLRHLEYDGTMNKVIGVLKMRTSDFEKTLRTIEFTEYGVSVGVPLEGLTGVLTGTPTLRASASTSELDGSDDARQ
jgi:circadian clock protein KaiC